MALWTETGPDHERKNRVLASAYRPGERVGQFEKAVLI
jgi:hypothetical protein